MDCVAGDFSCYVEFIRLRAADLHIVVQTLLDGLASSLGSLWEELRPHIHWIIALGSLSFAVWKWYRYRESALFIRLKELCEKTVRGLRAGRSDLVDMICRPAPGQSATAPLFIEESLRRVLMRRNWRRILDRRGRLTIADRQLDRALREIDKQLQWTEMRQSIYREQRATVLLLKGAIASARSERAENAQSWWRLNNQALAHFRDALGVPGNERDIQATEYKAHQLRKLGQLSAALTAYTAMETLTEALPASRQRSLLLARSRRYQADAQRLRSANRPANILLSAGLRHLAPYDPLVDRELLEEAEIHETQGCVRLRLGFRPAANESFGEAEAGYQRLVDTLDPAHLSWLKHMWRRMRRLFRDDGVEAMRAAASAGIVRVQEARQSGQCGNW